MRYSAHVGSVCVCVAAGAGCGGGRRLPQPARPSPLHSGATEGLGGGEGEWAGKVCVLW